MAAAYGYTRKGVDRLSMDDLQRIVAGGPHLSHELGVFCKEAAQEELERRTCAVATVPIGRSAASPCQSADTSGTSIGHLSKRDIRHILSFLPIGERGRVTSAVSLFHRALGKSTMQIDVVEALRGRLRLLEEIVYGAEVPSSTESMFHSIWKVLDEQETSYENGERLPEKLVYLLGEKCILDMARAIHAIEDKAVQKCAVERACKVKEGSFIPSIRPVLEVLIEQDTMEYTPKLETALLKARMYHSILELRVESGYHENIPALYAACVNDSMEYIFSPQYFEKVSACFPGYIPQAALVLYTQQNIPLEAFHHLLREGDFNTLDTLVSKHDDIETFSILPQEVTYSIAQLEELFMRCTRWKATAAQEQMKKAVLLQLAALCADEVIHRLLHVLSREERIRFGHARLVCSGAAPEDPHFIQEVAETTKRRVLEVLVKKYMSKGAFEAAFTLYTELKSTNTYENLFHLFAPLFLTAYLAGRLPNIEYLQSMLLDFSKYRWNRSVDNRKAKALCIRRLSEEGRVVGVFHLVDTTSGPSKQKDTWDVCRNYTAAHSIEALEASVDELSSTMQREVKRFLWYKKVGNSFSNNIGFNPVFFTR